MSGDRSEGGGGAVVLAFLAGVVVGAAAALLLAPRPGAETRDRLAGAAGDVRDRARRTREAAKAAADAARRAFAESLRQANGGDQDPPADAA